MKAFECNKYRLMIKEVFFSLLGQIKEAKKETAKHFLKFKLSTDKLQQIQEYVRIILFCACNVSALQSLEITLLLQSRESSLKSYTSAKSAFFL